MKLLEIRLRLLLSFKMNKKIEAQKEKVLELSQKPSFKQDKSNDMSI